MFQQSMDFVLENVESGAAFPLKVQAMTLGNKANMDEWLRMVYMKRALRFGDSIEEAEKAAERLDILANPWFLSDNRRAARILYELGTPNMSFTEFENAFFNLDVRLFDVDDGEEESPQVKRLKKNIDAFTDAYEFACKNPTRRKSANTEPESNPEPAQSQPASALIPSGSVAPPQGE